MQFSTDEVIAIYEIINNSHIIISNYPDPLTLAIKYISILLNNEKGKRIVLYVKDKDVSIIDNVVANLDNIDDYAIYKHSIISNSLDNDKLDTINRLYICSTLNMIMYTDINIVVSIYNNSDTLYDNKLDDIKMDMFDQFIRFDNCDNCEIGFKDLIN